MRTVESALEVVLSVCGRLPGEVVTLAEALGRTLDQTIQADRDMPPFDKALVDGFAIRSADLANAGLEELAVVEEIDAGGTPRVGLGPKQAALVMTGAPLPSQADAVVMLEDAHRAGDRVWIRGPVRSGSNRLERGREYQAGQVVLPSGTALNAPRLGVLAATGHLNVRVVRRPRVAVVTTGDELVNPEQTPGPGQIRDSNGIVLAALVRGLGNELVSVEQLPDREGILRERFAALVSEPEPADPGVDVVLVSGGVSAGRRDLVPQALQAAGVRQLFHKVNVKPGKPLWFGIGPEREGCPPVLVFGLPGNPVSVIVSVLLFAAPAFEVLAGRPAVSTRLERRLLAAPFSHRGTRPTYHPARRLPAGRLAPLAWAGSADLLTVARADGFAVFAAGDRDYPEGMEVPFLPVPSTLVE